MEALRGAADNARAAKMHAESTLRTNTAALGHEVRRLEAQLLAEQRAAREARRAARAAEEGLGAVAGGGGEEGAGHEAEMEEALAALREEVAAGLAPPPPRTKWTRRVPRPVLIGHDASLGSAARGGGG